MKESWVCRNYKSGDEYQILALYKEVNNKEMSLDYWKWRYVENPFGNSIIKLILDKEKLIGHYAVTPIDVQAQGKLHKAAFSMNTMTHPDYEGKGIFTYLAQETYKDAKQSGFTFVYGFPNRNSYYGFTRKLDWRDLGKTNMLLKELESKRGIKECARVYQIERFGDEVNLLWEKVKKDYRVIVPRTKEFLNWRFVQNPAVVYLKYLLTGEQGEVLGYTVLKTYSKREETVGHIIDMLSIKNDAVVKRLLEYAYGYFIGANISRFSCWMPDNCFYTDVLREEGFTRREMETYFGLKVLDEQDDLLQIVTSVHNWYLTMGDSDVF